MYTAQNKEHGVSAMILDSTYANFQEVFIRVTEEALEFPKSLVRCCLESVTDKVTEVSGGMELSAINPIEYVPDCTAPAFFIHGEQDKII